MHFINTIDTIIDNIQSPETHFMYRFSNPPYPCYVHYSMCNSLSMNQSPSKTLSRFIRIWPCATFLSFFSIAMGSFPKGVEGSYCYVLHGDYSPAYNNLQLSHRSVPLETFGVQYRLVNSVMNVEILVDIYIYIYL